MAVAFEVVQRRLLEAHFCNCSNFTLTKKGTKTDKKRVIRYFLFSKIVVMLVSNFRAIQENVLHHILLLAHCFLAHLFVV